MTKEQLRNYKALKNEHRQIEQRLRNLERRPESEEEILQPLREHYEEKLAELVAAELEVENAIKQLSTVERQLVRLRYFEGLPWYRVAVKIGYSEPQAKRIGRRVLTKIEKI